MPQHFLLSAAARTLSLAKVMRMTEEAARETFKGIRWAATNGEPVCPVCGSCDVYDLTTRKTFKCAACYKQFSVTSGTIFARCLVAYRFTARTWASGLKRRMQASIWSRSHVTLRTSASSAALSFTSSFRLAWRPAMVFGRSRGGFDGRLDVVAAGWGTRGVPHGRELGQRHAPGSEARMRLSRSLLSWTWIDGHCPNHTPDQRPNPLHIC